ncbi:helix-turn-helix domain-containing protein [uncultured Bilophila sp.]|uniref:helix-turn-helix domain-containing protein n=1 Tax=uncultured Bilophila sp. TaxID=529385 RepID=UPI0025D9D2A0|nr:helix-turn-helix domain-containing protein [uncultured Bilophila sp.]
MKLVEKADWPLVGMTVDETAAALRVDRKTVLKAIREGGLPARKVGVGWRIDHDAVKQWLASGKPEKGESEE